MSADAEIVFTRTVDEIFEAFAADDVDYAVIPLRNSISGWIESSMKGLAGSQHSIAAETQLPIKHHLGGFGKIEDVRTILTHPHSYKQCKETIDQLIPKAEIVFTNSNIDSAIKLVEKKDPTVVAIIPETAALKYDIPLLQKDIEEDDSNETQFILLSKESAKVSGQDNTALMIFEPEEIRKEIREYLKECDVKLILMDFIEGNSLYYVELDGHISDLKVRHVYEELKSKYETKFLGSYPKS